MNNKGEVISNVFNISIITLMASFQTKCKKKVLGVLKSLELKGYIKIIKSIGKTNKYKVIKSYFNNIVNKFEGRKENHYSNEGCSTGDFYSKNTGVSGESGGDISSGGLGTGDNWGSGILDTGMDMTSGENDTGNKIGSGESGTGEVIEPAYDYYEKCSKHEENSGFNAGSFDLEYNNYNLNNNYNFNYNKLNKNKKNKKIIILIIYIIIIIIYI